MRERRATLVLIGLVSLSAYILACRASFSPDGSKILFPYGAVKTDEFGVAIYDRETGESRSIFTHALPLAERSGNIPVTAQWTPDGDNVILAWGEEGGPDHLRLMLLPLEGKQPARFFAFPDREDLVLQLLNPLPVLGNRVFIGGRTLTRLDLGTGEVTAAEVGGEVHLAGQGDQLYYMTRSSSAYRFGRIDTEALALMPVFATVEIDLEFPILAVSRDGSSVAVSGKVGTEYRMVVFRDGELEKTVSLGATVEGREPGNNEWSPDGKTIYSAFGRKLETEDALEFGFLEVPLSGEGVREVSLFRVSTEEDDRRGVAGFQIALSPDGDTIVASNLHFGVSQQDRALYLLDLTSSERKVTKVPMPLPTGGKR